VSNVIVFVDFTLGGVMRGPAAAEENTRGDFKKGGCARALLSPT